MRGWWGGNNGFNNDGDNDSEPDSDRLYFSPLDFDAQIVLILLGLGHLHVRLVFVIVPHVVLILTIIPTHIHSPQSHSYTTKTNRHILILFSYEIPTQIQSRNSTRFMRA
jgi:hypothetical protein